METAQRSVELARYKDLVPYQSQLVNAGLPRPLMEFLAAGRVYPVLSPEGLVGRNAEAMVRGAPGLCVTILKAEPGDGPQAHNHTGTIETFFCLDGRFEVTWGSEMQHRTELAPNDLCSVPAGIYRAFKNIADEPSHLMVFIQGDAKMSDRVSMHRSLGEKIAAEYGPAVIEKLANINMRFDGDAGTPFGDADMQERLLRVGQWREVAEVAVAQADAAGATEVAGARVAAKPLLAPEREHGAAVQGAAGSAVRMLDCAAGASFVLASTPGVARSVCARTGDWTISWGDQGESVELGRYDYAFFPDRRALRVQSRSASPEQLLVIDQYPL